MKQKKALKIVLIAALILAVMGGMYAIYRHFSPSASAGEKSITISIIDADGVQTDYPLNTDAEYLKEALEAVAAIEGEEGEYGYTLYSVNGKTADFSVDSSYWAIYVNNEYGMYSLSQQPVADGDSFVIAYETY